jgi:hypothetical protein
MIGTGKNAHLKRENMTPQQLAAARSRAAHAREIRKENARKRKELKMSEAEGAVKEKRKYKKKQDDVKIFLDNFEAYKALNAKIASLEHQAVQYRTVIDYLESKVDSLLSRK